MPRFGGLLDGILSAAKRALAAMRCTIDGGNLSLASSFKRIDAVLICAGPIGIDGEFVKEPVIVPPWFKKKST